MTVHHKKTFAVVPSFILVHFFDEVPPFAKAQLHGTHDVLMTPSFYSLDYFIIIIIASSRATTCNA